MSDESPKITLKAGAGYEQPWVTIPFDSPDEAKAKLAAIRDSGLLQDVLETAKLFQGASVVVNTPQSAPAQQAAPQQQQQPWGNSAPQQQQAAPQQQNKYGGFRPHPEGLACNCGKVLEYKQTGSGKTAWRCPDWRWNNGAPNGHRQEWG